MFTHKTGGNKILMIEWSKATETQFCSVGPNHIFFWDTNTVKNGICRPKAGLSQG